MTEVLQKGGLNIIINYYNKKTKIETIIFSEKIIKYTNKHQ